MIRHYARLNAEKAPKELLSREGVVQLNDFGAQMGFGSSVFRERQFFQGQVGTPPAPDSAQPILTWPFLDFLDHLDLSAESLIELGAGYSTLWFSKRFAKVRSFETDPQWHASLARAAAANVELSLLPTEQLESAAFEYQGEAWLLVDFAGKRTAFLDRFLSKWTAPGRPSAIVLDNSDWYRRGAALLQAQGYLELPFYGFKSGQAWISCTSLFIDRERFIARQKSPFFQPAFSRALDNGWDSL